VIRPGQQVDLPPVSGHYEIWNQSARFARTVSQLVAESDDYLVLVLTGEGYL